MKIKAVSFHFCSLCGKGECTECTKYERKKICVLNKLLVHQPLNCWLEIKEQKFLSLLFTETLVNSLL